MPILHKADGFAAQKLLVLPEKLLRDIASHPLIQSLYVTDIGFFPDALFHYRERPEGCNEAIFIYCTEGEGWALLAGERITILPGTLLVIPAHTPHSYGAAEASPWSIYWFHLKGKEVANFLACLVLTNSTLHISATQAVTLLGLFNTCYETLCAKGYSWRHHLFVSQAMRHLLGSLAVLPTEAPPEARKNAYIDQAIHYMLDHLPNTLSLAELAQVVHLSRSHLLHIFKETTGYTPMDYFMRLKIQHTCSYLDLTDQPIKEIGQKVGLSDPYYFSRVFHKIMGQSPSEYRKNGSPPQGSGLEPSRKEGDIRPSSQVSQFTILTSTPVRGVSTVNRLT